MNDGLLVRDARDSGSPRLGFLIVAQQELRDLWLGTPGLAILLAYSALLSVLSFIMAGNSSLNLLDARETVNLVVQVAMGFGGLAALVVSAGAISGERERGTLEHILLTPLRRRDLVIGKGIAAYSTWLVAMIVAVPYIAVLSNGPGLVGDSLVILAGVGSVSVLALTALGMIVSVVSPTNRTSLVVAFALVIALAAPSQLPQASLRGIFGEILITANPISSALKLTGHILIDRATWASQFKLLMSPVIASAVLLTLAAVLSQRLTLGGVRWKNA